MSQPSNVSGKQAGREDSVGDIGSLSDGRVKLRGRAIFAGQGAGLALVSRMGISFFGGVDPDTGVIVEPGHDLEGQSIAGRVLVFPTGKGSTVGSYTLYRLKKNGLAPAAILNAECETITAVGCIISEIPCVDQIPIERIPLGARVVVEGEVIVIHLTPGPFPGREGES